MNGAMYTDAPFFYLTILSHERKVVMGRVKQTEETVFKTMVTAANVVVTEEGDWTQLPWKTRQDGTVSRCWVSYGKVLENARGEAGRGYQAACVWLSALMEAGLLLPYPGACETGTQSLPMTACQRDGF